MMTKKLTTILLKIGGACFVGYLAVKLTATLVILGIAPWKAATFTVVSVIAGCTLFLIDELHRFRMAVDSKSESPITKS